MKNKKIYTQEDLERELNKQADKIYEEQRSREFREELNRRISYLEDSVYNKINSINSTFDNYYQHLLKRIDMLEGKKKLLKEEVESSSQNTK